MNSLGKRLAAIEAQQSDSGSAPDGALPVVVSENELDSPEASRLHALGYQVMTFEQCADAMV